MRTVLMLTGLTLLFIIDDVLFILLAREWTEGPWHWVVWTAVGLVALGGSFLLALVVYKALCRKPQTGAESLIGEVGKAITDLSTEGQVFLHGEIWSAESEEPVAKGEKVVVVGIQGLRLKVRRAGAD